VSVNLLSRTGLCILIVVAAVQWSSWLCVQILTASAQCALTVEICTHGMEKCTVTQLTARRSLLFAAGSPPQTPLESFPEPLVGWGIGQKPILVSLDP